MRPLLRREVTGWQAGWDSSVHTVSLGQLPGQGMGCGMGQFGTQCSLASSGGRELGHGMEQFGIQCVPWHAVRAGKWDIESRMGQVGSQYGPWPARKTWKWDVGCGIGHLVPNISLGQLGGQLMGHKK